MEPTNDFWPTPDEGVLPPAQAAEQGQPGHRPGRRVKAMVAGLALAAMLGGGAVSVFAASPDPSGSPTPTTAPSDNGSGGSDGTTAPTKKNCPHDLNSDSSTDQTTDSSTSS